MIKSKNNTLNIGDLIGFVSLAQNTGDRDAVIFFPIVEVTSRDGETVYLYQYPDGNISRAGISESQLSSHVIKVERVTKPMICLNERKDEFKRALKRGLNNEFTVYSGWKRDVFQVVNKTNGTDYRVELKTTDGKAFAQCECPDFRFRKHICKHIVEVLQETFFAIGLAV